MITRVFWPENYNLKLKLPDKNSLNHVGETENKISPSAQDKNHVEKDFPET